jgi:serine/threonine protein kinase
MSEPLEPGKPAPAPLVETGTIVGRYRVLRRIGVGAMGEVYLAVDEQLGRRAAIKVLGSRHFNNAVIKERFLREARALAQLSHVNLITVYEAGHVGEVQRPYFAMELLEGGDTQKLLDERGPLPAGVVASIGAQAAAGLAHAAKARIIHRDVKPANLGISAHGILKVTDFGLAKNPTNAEKSLTGEGFVVGTADYIAPEQARGEELDERADVYALGGTLFHLATGRPPFRSEGATQVQRYADVMRAHLVQPVPDPRRLVRSFDPEAAQLIMRLMDKDREVRPTFDELAPLLARHAGRLGGQLPRVTRQLFTLPAGVALPGERLSADVSVVEAVPVSLGSVEAVAPAVHRRWPRLVGVAALVAAVVTALVALLHH